ncbi:MAG: DMT family transporter [Candidatus Marsarchaeota archaeon]|nr:DMT family transporter [Candidatus Marsarchaeota archaeon]
MVLLAGVLASILAMSSFVIGDVVSKVSTNSIGVRNTVRYALAAGILPAVIAVWIAGFGHVTAYALALSIISGVLMVFGYKFLYSSLATEQVTDTFINVELIPALMVIFGLFWLKERITDISELGTVVIFIGIGVVLLGEEFKINRSMIPATVGSAFYAVSVLTSILAVNASRSFAMPLFVVMIVALTWALFSKRDEHRKSNKTRVSKIIPALTVGILNGVGGLMIMYASYFKLVTFAGAITALEPVFVGVAGYLFFKEKLNRMQLAGFILAISGAVLLGL